MTLDTDLPACGDGKCANEKAVHLPDVACGISHYECVGLFHVVVWRTGFR
jgi:hypothetical protein